MELFTALIVSVLVWVGTATGDLRCYCNEAACISTAYMCKSTSGTCYSMIPFDGRSSTTSVHGCVESLPGADRAVCRSNGDLRTQSGGTQELPILLCCSDDMCNYSDSLDIKIYVNSKAATGNSVNGDRSSSRGASSADGSEAEKEQLHKGSASYSERLLFDAAVIAVPIAGSVLLVLLVLVAVRVLRNDSRQHRQMRQHRSLTKAQLYVADHFAPIEVHTHAGCCEKHHHHAHVHSWSSSTIDKHHNSSYKDVNVKLDYSNHGYKKMTNSSQDSGLCSSIIVWGKSESEKSAPDPPLTVV